MAAWTMIEPDSAMINMVRRLRQRGIRCYLATNQEPRRASYMSEQLGYRDLFDGEFYSCRLGLAKPAAAFFHSIVKDLGLQPMSVLFLDDHEVNVNSAREVGLHASQFLVDSGPLQLEKTLRGFGVDVASNA
jgi:putative hydrolase of the HAD superfamily